MIARKHHGWPFGCLLLFAMLAAYKLRGNLLEGRFWAEEGSVFFAQISQLSTLNAVTYLFNGHLELLTNLLILASTHVAFQHAPLVTMYGALLIQLFGLFLIALKQAELGLSRRSLYALAIVMAGLPQAPEVWANSINIHFHMALACAVVLATQPGSPNWIWLARGTLMLGGLSGIPSNFLTPMAGLLALRRREKEYWIRFAILAATTLMQLGLLSQHHTSSEQRSLTTDPAIFWLAALSQQVISPLSLFRQHAEFLIGLIKPVLEGDAWALLWASLMTMAAMAGVIKLLKSEASASVKVLLGCSGLLTFCSIAVSLGNKVDLVSAAGHGRYFYAPNVLLAICLLSAVSHAPRRSLIMAVTTVLMLGSVKRLSAHASGPHWRDSLKAAHEGGVIAIHPDGWYMRVPTLPGELH